MQICSIVINMALNAVNDHFQRNKVLAALEHNEVGIFLARLDKLLVHRFDRVQILRQYRFQASAALRHITLDASDQADILIVINKNLNIHL